MHYTALVRRLTVLLLGAARVATAEGTSALHVHVYPDHDHPGHRHGPAAPDHRHSPPQPEHEGARLEPCPPGMHVLTPGPAAAEASTTFHSTVSV